ncbi:YkvA family protein [Bosea sp. LC85]|uniref:YkvA family protein n=1 Tax=Bosea sp. LC85 TaxID=1502851 RepID=UPI001FCAE137|nr:YkvA family protein [Bosea sp. LC85]
MSLLKRVAKRIPFAEDLLAAYFCTRDPATPRRVRLTLLAALGYFVLPVDAIPDIMPILGFSDDAAVMAAAIAAVAGSITPKHRQKAQETLAGL